ncbi:MAG: hypothetical protein QWI73_07060, partial [Alphaproteobacteria bacterium]|nr:hypothetical protein [Alphaproteobacteria bacterium]
WKYYQKTQTDGKTVWKGIEEEEDDDDDGAADEMRCNEHHCCCCCCANDSPTAVTLLEYVALLCQIIVSANVHTHTKSVRQSTVN